MKCPVCYTETDTACEACQADFDLAIDDYFLAVDSLPLEPRQQIYERLLKNRESKNERDAVTDN